MLSATPLDVISGAGGLEPQRVTPAADGLYFLAPYDSQWNRTTATRLWYTNGQTSGTRPVLGATQIPGSAIGAMAAAGSDLYFTVRDTALGITELYVCQGGVAHPVSPDNNGTPWHNQYIDNLASINGEVYFVDWWSGQFGIYWNLEEAQGTSAPKELYSGYHGLSASHLTGLGNKVFFSAAEGANDPDLYVYDPSRPPDKWVYEVSSAQAAGRYPARLTAVGNLVYYAATTSATGRELWVSDGTAAGTHVIEINPGSTSSNPENLVNLNGTLFFTATRGQERDLFEIPGPGAAPRKVSKVLAFESYQVAGSYLYARLDTGSGTRLSIISTAGTIAPIADPLASHSHGPAANLTAFGGTLYFTATTSTNRVAVWKVVSANRVLPVASNFWGINQMLDANGTLYVAGSGTGPKGFNLGNELWKVDDNVPPPVPSDDVATVAYEGTVKIPVLSNDKGSLPLTIVAVSAPAHGRAYSLDGKDITYVAPQAFAGKVTFNYTVSDGQSKVSATVTVTVKPPTADQYPRVGFLQTSSTVNENAGYANIVVGISKPFVYAVTVNFTITPGSAKPGVHYTVPAAKSLIFAPGVISQTIRIPLINDKLPGPNRNAVITLSNAKSAKIGPKFAHTFTIIDSGKK